MNWHLKLLDFEISQSLANRLEAVSHPEAQLPYSFFSSEIQGMIHGGVTVGNKPDGYEDPVIIRSSGAGEVYEQRRSPTELQII